MINSPLGTKDLLPEEAQFWHYFSNKASNVFTTYGYKSIITPIFEQKDLYVRGIGSDTDVVSKEMFNVLSDGNLDKLLKGSNVKSKSHFALRPEGTAGIVRAIIQNSLATPGGAPVKLMYSGPMFRAERPGMGRYRQFLQLGVECIGASDPSVDAEAVIMMMRFYKSLGFDVINDLNLVINSMGCKSCRGKYKLDLQKFLYDNHEGFCETCKQRSQTNPLRVLDCKCDKCIELLKDAPKISDYLCKECREHYETFKSYLDSANISYSQDFKLVRGLDYYTRSVFELKSSDVGSQDALAGGGRYDGLVKELGGTDLAGFGFALGYERTFLAMSNLGLYNKKFQTCDVFIACAEIKCKNYVFDIAQKLRDLGYYVEIDHQNRSLKSQFKLAAKLFSKLCVIVGSDEIKDSCVSVRNMNTHCQEKIKILYLQEYIKSIIKNEKE